jgi:hypothetical protein
MVKQGEQFYPTIMEAALFPTTVPLMGEADYPIAAVHLPDWPLIHSDVGVGVRAGRIG